MTEHNNITIVQGDCLKANEIDPEILKHSFTVIHSVGAITDTIDYKRIYKHLESLAEMAMALYKKD